MLRINLKLIIVNTALCLGLFILTPSPLFALTPGPEQYSCFDNEDGVSSEGNPCSYVNCEWRNVENSWLGQNVQLEDCKNPGVLLNENNYDWVWLVGLFLASASIAFFGTILRLKKTPKKKHK